MPSWWKITLAFVVGAVVTAVVLPPVLKLLGFGVGGVIAKTLALALVQSLIGNVSLGHWFAVATSAGATGTAPWKWCIIGGAVAVYAAWDLF